MRPEPPYRNLVPAALLLWVLPGLALAAPATMRFEHITSDSGLSHNTVLSILEDGPGFLWFGTFDGLNRYDGYEFRVFHHDPSDPTSLSHNVVRSLIEDRQGRIWVGTEDGLNRFDRSIESFVRYRLGSDESSFEPTVHALFEDHRGVVWAGTSSGLFFFDEGLAAFVRWRPGPQAAGSEPGALQHADVLAIHEDRSGDLWVLTSDILVDPADATLHQLDAAAQRFRRYSLDGEWGPVWAFWIDRAGRFWINGAGPVLLDPESGLVASSGARGESQSVVSPPIRAFWEDPNDVVWLGSEEGLFHWDPTLREAVPAVGSATDSTWLRSYVLAIQSDRSGALWLGTLSGLFRHDPNAKAFDHLRHDPADPDTLSSSAVSAVLEDDSGTVWVGTYGAGLNRVDRSLADVERHRHRPRDGSSLCDDVIWDIYRDRVGILWLGTEAGLCRLEPESGSFRRVDLQERRGSGEAFRVTDIVEDDSGSLWLASFAGLYQLARDSGSVSHFPATGDESGPSDRQISSLHLQRPGALWLGTIDGVLNRFDIASRRFDHFRLLGEDGSPLHTEGIFDILEDAARTLWLGTASGLIHFDPQTREFEHYFQRDGLPGSVVYSLLPDNLGRIWLGTSGGISRFEKTATGASFRNFNAEDGTGSTEFNRHAAFSSPSGELFFGGIDGLTTFFPEEIQDNAYVPPVVLTGIQASNKTGMRTFVSAALDRLVLSYRDYTFGFQFSALSFSNAANNRYAYKLEGFDDNWQEAGTGRFARYTNIPPGDYRFRVRGSNNDGVWNEVGATLELTVTPPFWQTWWFRLLIAVTVLSAVTAAYRYRVERLLEMERLRVRIAADLHDDLGGELSAIAMATAMVSRRADLDEQDRDRLAGAQSSAMQLMDGVRDVVWYINPEHDTLDSMARRMKTTAASLLDGVSHTFEIDLRGGPSEIAMALRRDLYLVFKESINNIARHADANNVSIVLRRRGDRLRLEVVDDGRGFEPEAAGDGNGLSNLRQRADQMGAELAIDSRPLWGTRIVLDLRMARTRGVAAG